MDIKNKLEEWIPNLIGRQYKIVSVDIRSADVFNCVSYTLNIFDEWTWTNDDSWDTTIPRNLKLE